MTDAPLLQVTDLEKHFPITEGVLNRETGRVRAVDGITFDVRRGETVGLIGESGCGKSTAAASLLRLDEPTGGTVEFDGEDVLAFDDDRLRQFRQRTGMLFQDPTGSFDPRLTVGQSVGEFLLVHGIEDAETRRAVAEDLFERVGLAPETFDRYPHELSGGQQQRAALARALVVNPDLLVADEPVSALDLSIQAAVLSLIEALQAELDLAVLLISHDVSVVREVCDRVNVMYLGEIVESGPTDAVLDDPDHPYTRALVSSAPTPDPRAERETQPLAGEVPDVAPPPSGCRFHTRCPEVIPTEGFDGDPDGWRAAFDLHLTVADEEFDAATLADRLGDDPTPAEVRAAYDVPATLRKSGVSDGANEEASGSHEESRSDVTVALEDALDAAVEALADGDVETARRQLASFESPCVDREPTSVETSAGGTVACHRIDEA